VGTFLFDSVIFGPVFSRRLGRSLGINLLPDTAKICNYDCVYCECGWSSQQKEHHARLHTVSDVVAQLEKPLSSFSREGREIDTITFAGNGEPTLHPSFKKIMEEVIRLRDLYYPSAQIAVLSNASRAHIPEVREALMKADLNILKLDTAIEDTFRMINKPPAGFTLQHLLQNLSYFKRGLIIQSLFVRGLAGDTYVDNTTEKETEAWLEEVKKLAPELVMIYSIERATAAGTLEKVSLPELEDIARKVSLAGLQAEVYY
jgi:wyosine [tRNA(Phe)-imidazoG37] synthetase (radical SAM superfamily)